MLVYLKNITSNKVASWATLLIATFISLITLLFLYILIKAATDIYHGSSAEINLLYEINNFNVKLLAIPIAYLLINTYNRYKKGIFGTKLMVKLALLFSIVGIVPGLIIYTISYKFIVQSSLSDLFEAEKIYPSIESGVQIGNQLIKKIQDDSTNFTQKIAESYNNENIELGALKENLKFLNQQIKNKSYSIFDEKLNLIYGNSHNISSESINYIKKNNFYSDVEMNSYMETYRIRVIFPISVRYHSQIYYLQMVEQVPLELSKYLNIIQIANKQQKINDAWKDAFNNFYHSTLNISLVFVIFLSIIMAFWLGKEIIKPLIILDKNAKEAATGDLRPKEQIDTNDELGAVMRSFNYMIKQLSESRLIEQRYRNGLEAILTTMSSGVILLSNTQKLLRYNTSAEQILNLNLDEFLDKNISHINLKNLLHKSYYNFRQSNKWKFEYQYDKSDKTSAYLLISGNIIRNMGEVQLLIIIDDLTEILSAQRINAWGEVAKRLAHEIKNPLTPIQLSAERLQIKLIDKLATTEKNILEKSTNTIITQVVALKKLVDEFRHYSRLPKANFELNNLNDLIVDIVQLYKQSSNIKWQLCFDDIPEVFIDAGQIRQILHNLIQNAQDALTDVKNKKIQIFTSLAQEGVHLKIADNGPGFAKEIIDKIFEPYVTNKKHGTGLGMAIVKKIVEENQAKISINNRIDNNNQNCIMGAEVHIWFKNF